MKEVKVKCIGKTASNKPCPNNGKNSSKFCEKHEYQSVYSDDEFNQLKRCSTCNSFRLLVKGKKSCAKCLEYGFKKRKTDKEKAINNNHEYCIGICRDDAKIMFYNPYYKNLLSMVPEQVIYDYVKNLHLYYIKDSTFRFVPLNDDDNCLSSERYEYCTMHLPQLNLDVCKYGSCDFGTVQKYPIEQYKFNKYYVSAILRFGLNPFDFKWDLINKKDYPYGQLHELCKQVYKTLKNKYGFIKYAFCEVDFMVDLCIEECKLKGWIEYETFEHYKLKADEIKEKRIIIDKQENKFFLKLQQYLNKKSYNDDIMEINI